MYILFGYRIVKLVIILTYLHHQFLDVISSNNRDLDRRTVLKASGIGLAAVSGATMTVSASSKRNTTEGCEDCPRVKRIGSNDTYDVYHVDSNQGGFFVWVNAESKTVSYRRVGPEEGIEKSTNPYLNGEEIEPSDHENIFEDYTVFTGNMGDCGGYVYDDHYIVGISFRTGESLDSVPSDALEAAVCAVLGTYYGGPWVGAAAAVFCVVLGSFVLDHVDLSGHEMSVAIWDCHVGWLNEEAVCMGYAPGWYDDLSHFLRTKKISGPHLELGEDISEYL